MSKCPIIFGKLNKKFLLPLILAISQIIYVIINNYYLEKHNEMILHMFLLSIAEISIKLFPLILKINIDVETEEKPAKQKKCLHYFILCIIFIGDWFLISLIRAFEIAYLNAKESFISSNFFPLNDFIIMTFEMIFLVVISIYLFKYKYFKHHFISIIIITIFGIIVEILLNDYENMNGYFVLSKFMRIIEVGLNALYYCYQKYMMEKLYYPYWNIAFIPGMIMIFVTFGFLFIALIDSDKENSKIGFISSFYLFYTESDAGTIIAKIFVDFILHLIMCPLNILIIYYFTPNFILIIFMLTRITQNLIDNSTDKLYCIIFYFFQFFALMIHLEILELNFCDLNKFTKRNIDFRGIKDVSGEGRDSTSGFNIDIDNDYSVENPGNDEIEMSEGSVGGNY